MQNRMEMASRLGVLVGGGPAPGINGVIVAVTRAAESQGLEVMGLLDGFKWLAQGNISQVRRLKADEVAEARFQGGSILRTSRENPTENEQKMRKVVKALEELRIERLVTIGGDDTAYSASRFSEMMGDTLRVAHVPKTVDNDLPLGDRPTFGFETARSFGAQLIRNLVEDARTTQRWYVVSAMGRSAGHLALAMGLAGGATLTLIPEEFTGPITLDTLCLMIEGAMLKAKVLGQGYGVAVVAEGIAELLKDDLKANPMTKDNPLVELEEDEHGHLRLDGIPFALILKRSLRARAKARGEKITFVDGKLGYELRCADPVPFDVEYTQQLGFGAAQYLLGFAGAPGAQSGAMVSVREGGEIVPISFSHLRDPETGKTRIRRVDVNSGAYKVSRMMMTRLEWLDFGSESRLAELAGAAKMTPADFRNRFSKVVEASCST